MHLSFKSYIPFQTPPSIKKYLDNYHKKFISRKLDYYTTRYQYPSHTLFSTKRQNIEDIINLNDAGMLSALSQCYDVPPHVPDIKLGMFLFGLSSLCMFLLSKKY